MVSTSRCGRDILGSTPSRRIFLYQSHLFQSTHQTFLHLWKHVMCYSTIHHDGHLLVTSYMHSFPISNVLLKTTTHLTSSHRKIAIQHRHKCWSRKSRFNWLDGLDTIWRLHRCRSNKWHLHWLDCTTHRTSVTNTQGQCLQSMNEIEATMR